MHANWKAFTVAFVAGAAIGLTAWFAAPRKSLPVPVVPAEHSGDAAEAQSNSIKAPTSGIHFRIVDVDGASVANAHVVLRMEGRNGTFSSIVRGSADATGAFSAEANFLPGCRALTATVGLPDGGASRIHRLTRPEELTGAWEAGDLAMQPLKLIDIVVRDRSGAPISGAAVQTTEKERQPLFTHVGGRGTSCRGRGLLARRQRSWFCGNEGRDTEGMGIRKGAPRTRRRTRPALSVDTAIVACSSRGLPGGCLDVVHTERAATGFLS